MKRSILFLAGIISILKINAQSLPPTAQALYNEFYNNDVGRGQYAINNGAQALATADGKSFYLKWMPTGATPSLTPLLVTMHGSTGNVFDEFYLWHQKAAAKGVGIIAMQWYRGAASVSPNDYFEDTVIYRYIDTALKRIKYPSNKAFLHGFSRGSARSYAIAFYDTRPSIGKNYFCTVLSNSGKPDSVYTLYAQINSGMYGHSLYNGKRWAMFCGGLDPGVQTACWAMNNAKNWVQLNGGNVGLYISDPNLGHGGFHQTPAYIDSALNYYLPCFTGNVGIKENVNKNKLDVFPNPCKGSFEIRCDAEIADVEIFNTIGQIVYREKINASQKRITPGLKSGVYFLKIDFGIANEMKKIIIEE
ncbi:MAG: T9SS type A sorting domain-containing protein [Bacteroidia bacterium]|nr:T9SS type A sorting domain-containing protein [Bacteroidia bacterium]